MENLPLIIGAIVVIVIAFVIIRKVTAMIFRMTIVGVLIIVGIVAYLFRDQLPF